MTNQRESVPPEQPAAKKKKKSLGRRLIILLLVLCAVLGAAALTSMEDGSHFASLRRWLMYGDSGGAKDIYVYAADPANRYGKLGAGLLVVNSNTAQLISDEGSMVYDLPIRMSSPQLSVGARQAAICDVGGGALYILDQSGVRRTMQTEEGLCYFSANLNGSDYLAVTEQKNGYKAAISVYNSSGEPVFHFDSYDNYISDAIVSADCRSVVAVSLESQSGVFASKLLVYDLESAQMTGSRLIRDGLVMDFTCSQNRILCLCDKRFVVASLDGQILLDQAYGNLYLHDYALQGDGFSALLLGRYQSGNICTLTTYDTEGAQLAKLELTEEVLDISAAGDYLAVLYDDVLVVYTRDLQEHARLAETNYAGQIQMEPDGTVLMISGASAWRFLP